MSFDPSKVKLGRLPVRKDHRTLKLEKYLDVAALPAAPAKLDNTGGIKNWGMLANDSLGDCTIAGLLHMVMLWNNLASGKVPSFSNADAISLYSQLCGYVPGDPSTDSGGVEIDILNAWRKAPIKGCQLQAYMSVDPKDWDMVKTALYLFGTLYMGLALPVEAQNETTWSNTRGDPGSWGGHAVCAAAYTPLGGFSCAETLTCITWGTTQKMTKDWLAKYCEELYAPLSPSWFESTGKAPNGFDLAQLQTDLTLV